MNKYNNGKVYKITSANTTDVYVGSTTYELNQRLSGHERSHRRYLNDKTNYCLSFQIIEKGDYKITLIEAVNVNTKEELLKREGHHAKTIPNCINIAIAGRTQKEYYEDNKQEILDYHKDYYKINKDEIVQKQKAYKEANPELIKQGKKTHYDNKDRKSVV